MKKILTWGGRKYFQYDDSDSSKITIYHGLKVKETGEPWIDVISRKDYERLINNFAGKEILIGTSFDKHPPNSVGRWIKDNLSCRQIAYCIGAILIEEGYAKKVKMGIIKFN